MSNGVNSHKKTARPGTHGFTRGRPYNIYTTFSVGIFRWDESGSDRVQRTGALVRVSGSTSNAEAVYAKARAIVAELDAGTYSGPKQVTA